MSDKSNERKSHLLRLVVLMLCGALIPIPFSVGPGHNWDFWHYAAPYAQSLVGAAVGLMIELFLRMARFLVEFAIER
jgi:hypothetical protein